MGISAASPTAATFAGYYTAGVASAPTPNFATDTIDSPFGPSSIVSFGSADGSGFNSDIYSGLAGLSTSRLPFGVVQQRGAKDIEIEEDAVKRALGFVDQKKYKAARFVLAEELKRNPGSGAVAYTQGIVEQAAGNYADAEDFYRKASYLAPELNSLVDAENVRALQGDDATALARVKRLLGSSDTKDGGLRLLVTLTDRSPNFTEARTLLAANLLKNGDPLNALLQYDRAVGTANNVELDELRETFEGLAKRAPDGAFIHKVLGKIQLKQGDSQTALETLHQATTLSSGDAAFLETEASAYVAVGREKLSDGDLRGALSDFDQAYTLNPSGDDVILARTEGRIANGEHLAKLGDLEGAIDQYNLVAIDAGHEGAEALRERLGHDAYTVGRTLETRRIAAGADVGKELTAFQIAYDTDPENDVYRKKLAATRITLGDQYVADGDYKNAGGAYAAAAGLEPYNDDYRTKAIDAYTTYGLARLAVLDFAEALTSLRSAFNLDTQNTTSRQNLATGYNSAGVFYRDHESDKESAAGYFLEALHLYPDNAEYQANYDSVKYF